jgi:hypothetical protein
VGSGRSFTPRALTKLSQHTLKALGQLNVANGPQCINEDVEFGRADNQVDAIAIDIEQELATGIARVFGCHSGPELSRRTIRAKLSGSQVAVAMETYSAGKSNSGGAQTAKPAAMSGVHSS